jgi:predicted nucleic acid-binding protein
VSSWLQDSNILLRFVKPDDRDYPLVCSAVEGLWSRGDTLCYTSQNLGEFWNTCTRPLERNGYGLTPAEANQRASLIEAQFSLLPDIPAVHREWRRLLVEYSVSGAQVHDARLAAAMRVHGVGHILTFNTRDFTRYAGITAVHPAGFKPAAPMTR